MKIIIIDHEPFSERKMEHFFIDDFQSEGYDVEFWSMLDAFGYSKSLKYNYKEKREFVYYIKNGLDLKKRMRELDVSNTFVFVEFWFHYDTLFVHELLKKYKINWGRLEYYHNPVANFYTAHRKAATIPNRKKINNILSKCTNTKYLKYQLLKRLATNKFKELNTSKVSFLTGNNRDNLHPSEHYISIDYFDIEKYKTTIKQPTLLNYPYIVFADIYLGKHPDLQINNKKAYMDNDLYYQKLKTFFTKLEESLRMPVVIAAHPKASYNNEFGDRLHYTNQSANLIINSKMVLMHSSLSISFALLSNKNIIQFYTNDFFTSDQLSKAYETMHGISKQINSSCINIDGNYEPRKLYNKEVDILKYNSVLQKYFLKDATEERSNFNIVNDTIKTFFVC